MGLLLCLISGDSSRQYRDIQKRGYRRQTVGKLQKISAHSVPLWQAHVHRGCEFGSVDQPAGFINAVGWRSVEDNGT